MATKGVNEIHALSPKQHRMESKLDEIASLIRQMALNQTQQPTVQLLRAMRICRICANPSRSINACPTLQQDDGHIFANQIAAVANIFPIKTQYYHPQHQNRYDPCSSTYNHGRKNHPNFRYEASPFPAYRGPPRFQNNLMPN